MTISSITNIFDKEIEKCENEIKTRKNNIHSNYTLAQLDFTVIDNYTDSLQVYRNIREQLVQLQERVVERNSK